MVEINGLHLLMAVAVLFVFIVARSVQRIPIAVLWRLPLSQFLMAQVLRKRDQNLFKLAAPQAPACTDQAPEPPVPGQALILLMSFYQSFYSLTFIPGPFFCARTAPFGNAVFHHPPFSPVQRLTDAEALPHNQGQTRW